MKNPPCVLAQFTVFILLLTVATSGGRTVDAQNTLFEPLPSDLVFTGRESRAWEASPSIVLVNSTTLEMSPIYTSETAVELRVMSWSPQGDLLAVLHIFPKPEGDYGYPTTLCIVTLSGALQTCFDEPPPPYSDVAPFLMDLQYTVTWSADGEKVYYMAEDETREIRRLIEADTQTGETVRILYETQARDDEYYPVIMAWTPDFSHVAAGVGLFQRSGVMVNLVTAEQQDLSSIVVPWPGGSILDRPEGAGYVCHQFSPQGTYLTAIDEYDNRLLVFDKQLRIIYSIEDFEMEGQIEVFCPTWTTGEDIIYFVVYNLDVATNYIITYSLEDQRIIDQIETRRVSPPLAFSPARTHIAFTEPLPYTGRGTYRVGVMYPDGMIRYFEDPYLRTEYPVWRPDDE